VKLPARVGRLGEIVRDVLYGIFLHEHVMANRKAARRIEQLLFLVTMGDIVGIPIIPPYYSLRLMAHYSLDLDRWKMFVIRERDFTDFG
jgi:hypothetical protein